MTILNSLRFDNKKPASVYSQRDQEFTFLKQVLEQRKIEVDSCLISGWRIFSILFNKIVY